MFHLIFEKVQAKTFDCDDIIVSNCSQEILKQVYVTIAVLKALDFKVPPIGTLLYQFSDLVLILSTNIFPLMLYIYKQVFVPCKPFNLGPIL
jgi:hypothetical protein